MSVDVASRSLRRRSTTTTTISSQTQRRTSPPIGPSGRSDGNIEHDRPTDLSSVERKKRSVTGLD